MISIRCGHCGKDLKVRDELAGKKVKCPGCQQAVAVPQAVASVSPPPAGAADPKTLPPKSPPETDERTLPPKSDQVQDKEHTATGAGQVELTKDYRPEPHGSELTDFLAPPEQPDELGRLGGFRILKILGHGGMGVVFQGEDPRLGRKVAIKAMLPHLASSKAFHERFLREAKAAAALEHDHIVAIHHVGEDRGAPFIVMPFLQGEPLDARLKRDKILPVADVVRIGREITLGLAAAHDKGMIHRDIKPANVWLENRNEPRPSGSDTLSKPLPDGRGSLGRVKILDFGLARVAGDTGLTQTGAIVGTPQYMAPEQAGGKKNIDHRCDLFSLGCVLYRMSTGELPFKGDDTLEIISALAMNKPKEPRKINKDIPPPLSKLIMNLLAKSPEDRPQSAHEVANALAEIAATLSGEPKATPSGKPSLLHAPRAATWRRKWTLIAGGVLGALALAAVVFFVTSQERQRPEDDAKQTATLPSTFTNALGMEFVLIPKGKSWLRGGGGKPGDKEVEITEEFYLGKYVVTQEEWAKVMAAMPSHFSRAGAGKDAVKDVSDAELTRFPVENVSWDQTQQFLGQLNNQDKQEGWVYRLPKEVEWEYACRGGPMSDRLDSAFNFYLEKPTYTLLPDQANLDHAKGPKRTCKVGSYQPNKLGLYDMHGNVWQWCDDGIPAPKGAPWRVIRGCGWNVAVDIGWATSFGTHHPGFGNSHVGLRLARVPVGKEIVKVIAPEEKKPSVEIDSAPTFNNTLGMEFVLVPKGKALLGGGGGNVGDKEVTILYDFYLGRYEVTQGEWEAITGTNPSHFSRTGPGRNDVANIPSDELKRFPVETVSWSEAHAFLERLNDREKEAGWVYRLPKEAEWEYACRGGELPDKSDYRFDYYLDKPTLNLLPSQANFEHDKGLKRTCRVGAYKPNRLGLYDMHDNVFEWCDDAEKTGDKAPGRVVRGGSWADPAGNCVAAIRSAYPPSHRLRYLGLRLARVPVGKTVVVRTTAKGLQYEDLLAGSGPAAQPGDAVEIWFVGQLSDGKKLSPNFNHEKGVRAGPFPFVLGSRNSVPAFSEGVAGMGVGGQRRLWAPPSLGWGDAGFPAAGIPPATTVIFDVELAKITPAKQAAPEKPPATFKNSLGMELVLVPKGKSWLGGSGGKPGDKEVEVLHDFYLGKYEVTQEEWEALAGSNPSHWSRSGAGKDAVMNVAADELGKFPVENISWDDCQVFVDRLNKRAKDSGWVYRLPTETEWEYACRGGPMVDRNASVYDFYFAAPSSRLLPEDATFGSAWKHPCKVGSYKPNSLGLFDMHGNVWEWCADEIAGGGKPGQPPSVRPRRGGSWGHGANACQAAFRFTNDPSDQSFNIGLRLARVPVGKEIVRLIGSTEKKPAPSRTGRLIDVLKLVDVKRDAVHGAWTLGPEGLISDGKVPFCRLKLPYRPPAPPAEYEFRIEFTPQGNNDILQILPAGDRSFTWLMGAWGGKWDGFDIVAGRPLMREGTGIIGRASSIKAGKRHRSIVEVLKRIIAARIDGQLVVVHQTDFSDLGILPDWEIGKGTLGLGTTFNRVVFHKVEVVEIVETKTASATPTFTNAVGMEFVLVPKGKSWLGGGGGQPGEKQVEILHDFYLGKYEVTQDEWQKVTGYNTSVFKKVPGVSAADQKRFPVENVSWLDCQEFIEALNKREAATGWVYRLPKEAEWEYACRGGPAQKSESRFDFYFDKPSVALPLDRANFEHGKGLQRTCKVGSYPPNRLGLHDMHGNVWEWCDDQEMGKKGEDWRFYRGGAWGLDGDSCRAASRASYPAASRGPILGLRLARVPVGKEIVSLLTLENAPPSK